MHDSKIHQLSAYLDGDLPAAERAEVERRLAESETYRAELERMRELREWARDYPGRTPDEDSWPQIADGIMASHRYSQTEEPSARPTWFQRFAAGLAALVPVSPVLLQRTAIVGLVGVALFGMGSSFYLERRSVHLERQAQALERKTQQLDAQLVEVVADGGWSFNAVDLRGRNGQQFELHCPAFGRPGSVWGSGTYTDDSSICTAAVHAGLFTVREGGLVPIEIRPGVEAYHGTSSHGIESRDFGSWGGSFVITDRDGVATDYDTAPTLIRWDTDARNMRGLHGAQFTFRCMPGGEPDAIWGTGTYTDDSSICTAAVHAGGGGGGITFDNGGEVTIEILPGLSAYPATISNGVESRSYVSWSGSFAFVENGALVEPAGPASGALIEWDSDAMDLRGWNGTVVTFRCPPNGEPSWLWGTGVYTDDSSICTAAVHAGLITLEDGGEVTIEVAPGFETYPGSDRHGVESGDWESWSGSFSFVNADGEPVGDRRVVGRGVR